jgi:hypothetical protein
MYEFELGSVASGSGSGSGADSVDFGSVVDGRDVSVYAMKRADIPIKRDKRSERFLGIDGMMNDQ